MKSDKNDISFMIVFFDKSKPIGSSIDDRLFFTSENQFCSLLTIETRNTTKLLTFEIRREISFVKSKL